MFSISFRKQSYYNRFNVRSARAVIWVTLYTLPRGRKRKITNREFGTRNSPRGVQFSTRTRSLAHESDVIAVSLATVTTCWYHKCRKINCTYLASVWNVGRGFFCPTILVIFKSTPYCPGFTAKESIHDLHFIFSSWHFWVSIVNLSIEKCHALLPSAVEKDSYESSYQESD